MTRIELACPQAPGFEVSISIFLQDASGEIKYTIWSTIYAHIRASQSFFVFLPYANQQQ